MPETPRLDLGELERLLHRVAPHKSVSEVMGALTALASAPASPHPSEWLLTLTDGARFEDVDDARDFLAHVLAAYRELDAHLQIGEPVGPDPADPGAVAQWSRGYFEIARNDAVWAASPDAMRQLMPLALLAGELEGVGDPNSAMHGDEMRTKWTTALGNLVVTFYGQWADDRAAQRPVLPQTPSRSMPTQRRIPKIGPNAPCICGSGKKYKDCHGKT